MPLMVYDLLENKIEFLKGVGPKRAAILNKELGIFSFGDLLYHFPFRYVDKSRVYKVAEIDSDQVYYQLIGQVLSLKVMELKELQGLQHVFQTIAAA